jgi:uncharacterized protein YndB with AHSA1/START domain
MERTIELAAPPDEVWDALTQPELLASWFGADVEIEARRGGAVDARFPDGTRRRGVVQAVDPPRRLAFRWRPVPPAAGDASVVELVLRVEGGTTILTVVEEAGILGPGGDAGPDGGRRSA